MGGDEDGHEMSGIQPVQKQFGRTAAAYVESPNHAKGEDLDRIVALATEHGGERVVDVGTGVGHTLRRVAPSFRSGVGVDATREMLEAGVEDLFDAEKVGSPHVALFVEAAVHVVEAAIHGSETSVHGLLHLVHAAVVHEDTDENCQGR